MKEKMMGRIRIPKDYDSRRWSLRRARAAPFEVWVGAIAIINALAFGLRPGVHPVHALSAPWAFVWAISYGLAGICLLIGLIREQSAHIEAAGLCLLLAGVLVQILVFSSLGVRALAGTWGAVASQAALGAATMWRLFAIVATSRTEDRR